MRTAWPTRASVIVASLLAALACKSTQPARSLAGRTVTLEVLASATGDLKDCYEVYTTPDGSGPRALDYPACENSPGTREQGVPVPWRYTLSVSVIPAGSVTEQVVVLQDGTCGSSVAPCPAPARNSATWASMTGYDLATRGQAPAKLPDELFNPPTVYYFFNGKRVSFGSPEYSYLSNLSTPGQPRTPSAPLGPANILGIVSPNTFHFDVNSGDTVVIRARKQLAVNTPAYIGPSDFEPDVILGVNLTLGGSPVVPNGPTSTTALDGAGFTCSFVVQ